jgi:ligand-binding sensor domain-containing protein
VIKTTLIILLATQCINSQVIQRLTADRFTHYKIDDWISYAPALEISSIEIDENYIYFGSHSGGILRFNKYENKWEFPYTTSSGLRSNKIYRIVYDIDDGFLYAQTPAGIDVYKPAEKFWRPSFRSFLPTKRIPNKSEIENFLESEKNSYRFPVFYRPSNSELPDFFTDRSFIYHLGGFIFDQYNRQFNFTDRIVDSWQRLWIGTDGIGPMVAELDHLRLKSIPQSISNISPRDIFIDGNIFWIGGLRYNNVVGGITRWDRKNDAWQYIEASFVPQIYKDDILAITGNDRYVLFATILGLSVYDKQKDKWKTYDIKEGLEGNKILDVLIHEDTAYIATEYGLNWLDLISMNIYRFSSDVLDNVQINQLTHDGDLLWTATRYGLYSVDPSNDKITFYSSRAVLPDYNPTAIEIVKDQIWIANKYGIAFWNRASDQWRSFPELNFQGEIKDITSTGNFLWFATNLGLLRYSLKDNFWRIYDEKDGLISKNIFHLDRDGQYLWISTEKGITAFRWRRKGRID